MNMNVRDLFKLNNQIEGTYYKMPWDLLEYISQYYGTYLKIVWVLLEENELVNHLKSNTVKGLAEFAPLLIDLNRYKYNRITIYVSNETLLFYGFLRFFIIFMISI